MTVRYGTVLYKRRARIFCEPGGNAASLSGGLGQAGNEEPVDERFHGAPRGRATRDDRPEDEVTGQQVPEFIGDDVLGDLAPVDGLMQHVLDHGFALVEELVLQGVVERRVP